MHSAPLPSFLPFQDIFLLCFAVDNHVSYGNVRDTWIEEIRHHCPKTPVILVGTKVSRSLARSLGQFRKSRECTRIATIFFIVGSTGNL